MVLAAIARFGFLFISGKLQTEDYWEYGEIAEQLLAGHGYSFPFTDAHLNFISGHFYHTALMPPAYVFFLLPFLLVQEVLIRNLMLFGSQIFLSLLAIRFTYSYSSEKFGKTAALLILSFQAFYPEMIFACCTAGPTIWFHFLFAAFIFSADIRKNQILRGLIAGLLVLFRSEAMLLVGLIFAFEFLDGSRKPVLISALLLCLTIFPWLLRNQLVFGKPMLSASVGVNFFRGNNAGSIGDWPVFPESSWNAMKPKPESFEQTLDAAAMSMAVDWVKEEPSKFLKRLGEKLFRFWVIDFSDARTHSVFYWFPWLICLPAGIIGLRKIGPRISAPIVLLFLCYSLVILVFFPQPRYLSLVKFFWLIPAGFAFSTWVRKKQQAF
jgi:hypothetical protein